MFETSQVESITEYANNALTIQQPQGADYSQGVSVGRTIPAKWWNWLFRKATKLIMQVKADTESSAKDLQALVTYNGGQLNALSRIQVAEALRVAATNSIKTYMQRRDGKLAELAEFTIHTDDPELPVVPRVPSSSTGLDMRDIGAGWYALSYGTKLFFAQDINFWRKTNAYINEAELGDQSRGTDYTFCSRSSSAKFYAYIIRPNTEELRCRSTPLDVASEITLVSVVAASTNVDKCQPSIASIHTSDGNNLVFFMNTEGTCKLCKNDGTTITITLDNWTPLRRHSSYITRPVEVACLQLDDSNWLLGNLKLTKVTTSRYTLTPVFEGFVGEVSADIYDLINIVPLKLESGAIAFSYNWRFVNSFARYDGSGSPHAEYAYIPAGIIMLKNGTLVAPPNDLKLVPAEYQTVPGCVFAMKPTENSGWFDCYYSYDGTDFHKLPMCPILFHNNAFRNLLITYYDGIFVVAEAMSVYMSPTPNVYHIYSISGKLSVQLSDYMLLLTQSAVYPPADTPAVGFIADTGCCEGNNRLTYDLFETVFSTRLVYPESGVLGIPLKGLSTRYGFPILLRNIPWIKYKNELYFKSQVAIGGQYYLMICSSARPVSGYVLIT